MHGAEQQMCSLVSGTLLSQLRSYTAYSLFKPLRLDLPICNRSMLNWR
jgi:hypothetical protein